MSAVDICQLITGFFSRIVINNFGIDRTFSSMPYFDIMECFVQENIRLDIKKTH
jgi:hypothetical protein